MAHWGKRVAKELHQLQKDPPEGVSVWADKEDDLKKLEASVKGPEDSPFSAGVFRLSIDLSERYPFEPPRVRFVTPVLHPNIDSGGRICLDVLKMPPKGSWSPSQTIRSVLMSIRLLLAEPNPDDPLMPDIVGSCS
jgi:ubiquitin-conjugating enzyme E2 T